MEWYLISNISSSLAQMCTKIEYNRECNYFSVTSFWVIDLTEESIEIDTCAVFIGTKWNRQTGEIDIESNDKWREL